MYKRPYIDYWKGKYNLGDVFSETILSEMYDKTKLDSISDRKVMRFIGSEIPNKNWSTKNTYICGLGWRLKTAKLDPSWVNSDNYRYVRGKISRANVIKSGVSISPELPIGDSGLLASCLYKTNVKKKANIGLIIHWSETEYVDEYKRILNNKFPDFTVEIRCMGDKNMNCTNLFDFICGCEMILASSLHAIIFSHSFGVPVLYFNNPDASNTDTYKFEDYFSVYSGLDYDITKDNLLSEVVDKVPVIYKYQPKRYEVLSIQRSILNAFPYKECFSDNGKRIFKEVNSRNLDTFNIDDDCCGCGSCKSVCKSSAIDLKKKGQFLYPHINDKCINCGLCSKVCPVINMREDKNIITHHSVENKDLSLRNICSSGAVIPEFMKYVIGQGGVCFGVAWKDEYTSVGHIVVKSEDDIKKTIGSKYLECDNFEINHFSLIKDLLNKGIKVLYVGTPCQIASLTQYVKTFNIDTKKLFRVEIVCHGVPSKDLWNEYISGFGKKIKSVSFRDKRISWSNYSVNVIFNDDTNLCESFRTNDYMKKFLSDKYLRPSCLSCKFRSKVNNGADISVGDLWGSKRLGMTVDDRGTSIVNVNTRMGYWLMKSIENKINKTDIVDSQYDKIKICNNGLK